MPHKCMMHAAYGMPVAKNGVRVLIARKRPSWCGLDSVEVWIPELAPSASLIIRYKSMTAAAFDTAYKRELAGEAQRRALARLRRLAGQFDVVLCYGQDGRCCHSILASLLGSGPTPAESNHAD